MKRLILLTVEYQGKHLTVLAEDEIDEVSGGHTALKPVDFSTLMATRASALETLNRFQTMLQTGDDECPEWQDGVICH